MHAVFGRRPIPLRGDDRVFTGRDIAELKEAARIRLRHLSRTSHARLFFGSPRHRRRTQFHVDHARCAYPSRDDRAAGEMHLAEVSRVDVPEVDGCEAVCREADVERQRRHLALHALSIACTRDVRFGERASRRRSNACRQRRGQHFAARQDQPSQKRATRPRADAHLTSSIIAAQCDRLGPASLGSRGDVPGARTIELQFDRALRRPFARDDLTVIRARGERSRTARFRDDRRDCDLQRNDERCPHVRSSSSAIRSSEREPPRCPERVSWHRLHNQGRYLSAKTSRRLL